MPHSQLLCKLAKSFNIQGTFGNGFTPSSLTGSNDLCSWASCQTGWTSKAMCPKGVSSGPPFSTFLSMTFLMLFSILVLFSQMMFLFYRNIDSPAEERQLQSDLVTLNSWCVENGMISNTSNTKVMHVTRKGHINPPIYYLDDEALDSVSSFRYLGLTLSSDLSWKLGLTLILSSLGQTVYLDLKDWLDVVLRHPQYSTCTSHLCYLFSCIIIMMVASYTVRLRKKNESENYLYFHNLIAIKFDK